MHAGAREPDDAREALASHDLIEAQIFVGRLQSRRPLAVFVLLASIVVVFGLEQLWGAGSTATLVRMGAEVPSLIRQGEWWRLLAPTFLHSGLLHICMNGFGLWMLGSFVERLFGTSRFVVLYTVSGLCGTLLSGLSKVGLSVGASGALFGLLTAAAVLGLRPRGQIPTLIARDLRKNALLNMGIMVLISLSPHVDYLAHLGGALAGIVLVGSGLLRPTISLSMDDAERPEPTAWPWRLLCGVFVLGLYGSLAVALHHGKPWLLVRPMELSRQPLGTTGLSLEVPVLLGRAQIVKRDDGATEAAFGDGLHAPITLAVVTRPFDPPIPDEDSATLRQHFDGAVAALRDFSPGSEAVRIGDFEELTVDGRPALMMEFRYSGRGAILQRLFQVRPRYIVTLEVFSLGDTPNNLKLDLPQLLSSLRQASQL
jgi:rhomboid protease GluP